MRLIIGIIIGVAIVFNWGAIKTMFDSSLSKQGGESATPSAAPPPNTAATAQPAPAALPKDLNSAVEEKLKAMTVGK